MKFVRFLRRKKSKISSKNPIDDAVEIQGSDGVRMSETSQFSSLHSFNSWSSDLESVKFERVSAIYAPLKPSLHVNQRRSFESNIYTFSDAPVTETEECEKSLSSEKRLSCFSTIRNTCKKSRCGV